MLKAQTHVLAVALVLPETAEHWLCTGRWAMTGENWQNRGLGLFCFDVGCADHLRPLLRFVGNEPSEVGRRADKRCASKVGKPRLDLRIGKPSVYFPIQL